MSALDEVKQHQLSAARLLAAVIEKVRDSQPALAAELRAVMADISKSWEAAGKMGIKIK